MYQPRPLEMVKSDTCLSDADKNFHDVEMNNGKPMTGRGGILDAHDSTIHSGHFMVSHVHDYEDSGSDTDDALPALPASVKSPGEDTTVGTKFGFDFVAAKQETSKTYNFHQSLTDVQDPSIVEQIDFSIDNDDADGDVGLAKHGESVAIDASLSRLFECMTLAYSKLTSPRWKTFKGMKVNVKDKIRLNNIIWREWHMQYIKGNDPFICQFAAPLSDDVHTKPEAIVLEGKYWKRRLDSVTNEYQKWRAYYRQKINNHQNSIIEDMDVDACLLDRLATQDTRRIPMQRSPTPALMDEDFLMDLAADSFFASLSQQNFMFPSAKEIGPLGNADFIQPGLFPLQPNIEDFMDTMDAEMLTGSLLSGPSFVKSEPNLAVTSQQMDLSTSPTPDKRFQDQSSIFSGSLSTLDLSQFVSQQASSSPASLLVAPSFTVTPQPTARPAPSPSRPSVASSLNNAPIMSSNPFSYSEPAKTTRIGNKQRQRTPAASRGTKTSRTMLHSLLLDNNINRSAASASASTEPFPVKMLSQISQMSQKSQMLPNRTIREQLLQRQSTPAQAVQGITSREQVRAPQAQVRAPQAQVRAPQPRVGKSSQAAPRYLNSMHGSNQSHHMMQSSLPAQTRLQNIQPTPVQSIRHSVISPLIPDKSTQMQQNCAVSTSILPNCQIQNLQTLQQTFNQNLTGAGDIQTLYTGSGQPVILQGQLAGLLQQKPQTLNLVGDLSGNTLMGGAIKVEPILAPDNMILAQQAVANQSIGISANQVITIPVHEPSSAHWPSLNQSAQSAPTTTGSSILVQQLMAPSTTTVTTAGVNNFAVPSPKTVGKKGPRKPRNIAPATSARYQYQLPSPSPAQQSSYLCQLLRRGPQTASTSLAKSLIDQPLSNQPMSVEVNDFQKSLVLAAANKAAFNSPSFSVNSPSFSVNSPSFSVNSLSQSSTSFSFSQSLSSLDFTSQSPVIPVDPPPIADFADFADSPVLSPASDASASNSDSSFFIMNQSILTKNDEGREKYKEHRRVCHISAEQKRRSSIKNAFDTLHILIPSIAKSNSPKISKAAILSKTADYVRQLKEERAQMLKEEENLKRTVERLNADINVCQAQLPATGAPVTRQREDQLKGAFDGYVRARTMQNWKFWIFSTILQDLFTSFNSMVSTASVDDLCRTALAWLEQHCSLLALRPVALSSLRNLSKTTSILSDPSRVPQQAAEAVRRRDSDPGAFTGIRR